MILRAGTEGGALRTLNYYVLGGFVEDLENRGIIPVFTPSGALDWNNSISDWYTHNSNYTEWAVNIAPGMKWSDGTQITSVDILATYSDKFAFNASYDFTGAHNEVVSETAPNDSEVLFKLNKPDPMFLVIIGSQVLSQVAPAELINRLGPSATLFNEPNSGQFTSVGYKQGDTTMKMIRNPYYFPRPGPCELDMFFPETRAGVANLVLGGQLDFGRIDVVSASKVLSTPDLHLLDEKLHTIIEVNYNITLYPLNMPEFRQALVYGIDQDAIVRLAAYGYGSTAYTSEGTVPPLYPEVYNPNQTTYSYDPQKALQLLSSIGMNKGSDGLLHYPNGASVSLDMWTGNFAAEIAASGVVVNDLKQLGLTINLHVITDSSMYAFSEEAPRTIYLDTNGPQAFANIELDALPGWDVYTVPPLPNIHWMYPPNIDKHGDLSVMYTTTDPVPMKKAINDIQALTAQYLPVITVGWMDNLYAYSTARWTGWEQYPDGWVEVGGLSEMGFWSSLVPVGMTTSSMTQTNSTSSMPSASGGMGYTTLGAAVVVILVVVAAAVFALRGRKTKQTKSGPK